MKIFFKFLFSGITLFLIACSGTGPFGGSARDRYERAHQSDSGFDSWYAAYQEGVQNPVSILLPYSESGYFNPKRPVVHSYLVDLSFGEKLMCNVRTGSAVLIELRDRDGRILESSADTTGTFSFITKESGTFNVVVQPGLDTQNDFYLDIAAMPLYGFPVVDKGNDAIGSFWADVRDGGKRRHEGIDIFAKKGTPVVAVADGIVTYTGERGLGGKQVWQRTGLLGNSIYYAHLDAIAVEGGRRVKAGDTLGFVGNTGNARGTPAHLHFGIYTGRGAVDPLPFVKLPKSHTTGSNKAVSRDSHARIKVANANIRSRPTLKSPVAFKAALGHTLEVLGQSREWFHIKSQEGMRGFIHRSTVTIIN